MEYEVWSAKSAVVKYGVWSLKILLRLSLKKKPLVEGRPRSGKVVSKLYIIYIWETSAAVYVSNRSSSNNNGSSSSRSGSNGTSSSRSSSNSSRPSRIINREPIAQPIAMAGFGNRANQKKHMK